MEQKDGWLGFEDGELEEYGWTQDEIDLISWKHLIEREDLEISPGVIDPAAMEELTLNTFLVTIQEMVEDRWNDFPEAAWNQMETEMDWIFSGRTYVEKGRYPEPEEFRENREKPENVEARRYWTYICVNANQENWADIKKQLRAELPEAVADWKPKVVRRNIDREKEIEKNPPEWLIRMRRDGFVEL